jgi:hypothetical protein
MFLIFCWSSPLIAGISRVLTMLPDILGQIAHSFCEQVYGNLEGYSGKSQKGKNFEPSAHMMSYVRLSSRCR